MHRNDNIELNKIHTNLSKCENFSLKTLFTSGKISAKFRTAALNQTASRRKLNLTEANSTPNRAFFVRSIRTPQERPETLSGSERLSMVRRRGQPLAVGYLPLSIVSYPFTSYRQAVGSEAVSLYNSTEDTAMIYQFLCVNRNTKPYLEEVVQVQAINEDEARWQLTAEHALLATVGRYPDHQTQQATDRTARLNARLLAKFRPNLTACKPQGFTTAENGDNIAGTNSLNGNRSRDTSGIFLPQIYPSTGEHRPRSIEFAVRSIRRNKMGNRTNNASLFSEVVEAVPHPIKGGTFLKLFTKTLNTMNKSIPTPQANTAQNLLLIPRLFARFEGVSYA